MKKILVVLLILAVAGGLFAQSVRVAGNVQTGIAIGLTDAEEGGEAKVDYIRNRGEHGMRGDVEVIFRSAPDAAYGPYGVNIAFRGRANMFNGATAAEGTANTWAVSSPTTNLFWQPNPMVWIQVGTGGPNDFKTPGGLDRNVGLNDANGLKITLTPMDGLAIGAQAFYGQAATMLFEKMNYAFGVKYAMAGLFNATANFRYDAHKESEEGQTRFGIGANFQGLSSVGFSALGADIGTWNFGGDDSFIGIGEKIQFKALENALTLDAMAQQFFYTGKEDYSFMPLLFQGGVSYKIGVVTPAIEARYMMGAAPNWSYRNAGDIGGVDNVDAFGKNKDKVGLGISPRITFAVGPEIVLGYNLQMDLSDDASNKGTDKKLQHLIYCGVNLSF